MKRALSILLSIVLIISVAPLGLFSITANAGIVSYSSGTPAPYEILPEKPESDIDISIEGRTTTWGTNFNWIQDRMIFDFSANPLDLSKVDKITFDMYIPDYDKFVNMVESAGGPLYLCVNTDNSKYKKRALLTFTDQVTHSGWNRVTVNLNGYIGDQSPNFSNVYRIFLTYLDKTTANPSANEIVKIANLVGTYAEYTKFPALPADVVRVLGDDDGIYYAGNTVGNYYHFTMDRIYKQKFDPIDFSAANAIEFDIYIDDYDKFIAAENDPNDGRNSKLSLLLSSTEPDLWNSYLPYMSYSSATRLTNYIKHSGWNHVVVRKEGFRNYSDGGVDWSGITGFAIFYAGSTNVDKYNNPSYDLYVRVANICATSFDETNNIFIDGETKTLVYGNENTIIPNDGSVTSIGCGAFASCTNITSVTIPESVTVISDSAFYGCRGLTSVTIPDNVTSIGEFSFSDCTSLVNITIPNSVTSIGNFAFSDCTGLTSVTIPDSVTSIGYSAFEGCTGLTSITIPESVTVISDFAFSDCTGLTSITIPDSVTSIGNYAFRGCTGLTNITIPDSVTEIGYGAFSNCTGLTSIIIPDSVTEIGWDAFYKCTSLINITIPSSVTKIGAGAFSIGNSLESISVDSGNQSYYSVENCLIETDSGKIIAGCKNSLIPDDGSVTSIGEYAFEGCTGLTSITIPDSVTSIGEWAFYGCTGLTDVYYRGTVSQKSSISIASGNAPLTDATWHYIGTCGNNLSWEYDTTTDTLTISGTGKMYGYSHSSYNGDYVTTAPWRQYYNTIKTVVINSGVTSIGNNAFYGCTSLTSITIPDSVTSIGNRAFYNCTGLTSVTIGNGVTSIGECAFYNCLGLTSIIIPDSVTNIGEDAFSCCGWLTDVYYRGTVSQKSSISIASGNAPLTDATWHYIDDEQVEIVKAEIMTCETKSAVIDEEGSYAYFKFTPEEDGYYKFYSTSNDDTYGYIYDENMNELASNDDGGLDYNFKINYYMTAGTTYILGTRYFSDVITGSFDVTLERSVYIGIKEFVIDDITIVEGTNVDLLTDDNGNKYFTYHLRPDLKIALTDGSEFVESTQLSNYLYIDDQLYEFEISEDLKMSNFLPGNVYTLTGNLGGKTCEFNLTIQPSPIEKIELIENSEKYFVENYGGHFNTDNNGDSYYYYTVDGYDIWSSSDRDFADALFEITYKDGNHETITVNDYINGERILWINNQSTSHWKPGINNTQIYLMGVFGSLPITVIENPVENIELISGTTESYIENIGGSDGFYHTKTPDDAKIKINYKNNTSRTANVGDCVDGFYVEWQADQPWSIGENSSTITYLNHNVNLPIIVHDEDFIDSIEATLDFEFVEGYTINSYYQIPYNALSATVNYADGTSETKPFREWYYMTVDDNQDENPWVVGKNYITVHYGKHTCDLEITVIPNTVFADKHQSTVLLDDEIELDWLTDEAFGDLGLDYEFVGFDDHYNWACFNVIFIMDDEQLCNIAKQFVGITDLEIIKRFHIDETAYVQFRLYNNLTSDEYYLLIKTIDGENFEKVILPDDIGYYECEYEPISWDLEKFNDTYIIAGLDCKIGKELFYYTSEDLITWVKHTFSIDERTYCANLSFAAFSDNGVYFYVEKYKGVPAGSGSWLGWDIYFTSDFENTKCITDSFDDHTYYLANYKLTNSVYSDKIAFIAYHYYTDDYEPWNISYVDNVKLCSYDEASNITTVIESIDGQIEYFGYRNVDGFDPCEYITPFGNVAYTFSVENLELIQTAIVPFNERDIRAGYKALQEWNGISYYYDIILTSNELYISTDYWLTAYKITLPEEIVDSDIKYMDILKSENDRFLNIGGEDTSYYCDFTPIKNVIIANMDICEHIPAATVIENNIPATCVSAGSYDSVVYCADCGEELSRNHVTVPATGIHSLVYTDNGDGTQTVTCENCDYRVITGKCGTNATWQYNTANKTLTISGTGAMSEYSCSSYNGSYVTTAPWRPYYNDIKTVIINKGITNVSGYAFFGCEEITKISIPGTVTSMGVAALEECNKITSITIPVSVTSVGVYTFYNCTGIKNVYYLGTEADRTGITFATGNNRLTNATWHYLEAPKDVMNDNIGFMNESIDNITFNEQSKYEMNFGSAKNITDTKMIEIDVYVNGAGFDTGIAICDSLGNSALYNFTGLKTGWNHLAVRVSDLVQHGSNTANVNLSNISKCVLSGNAGEEAIIANLYAVDYVEGDANRDGEFNLKDIVRAKKMAAGDTEDGNKLAVSGDDYEINAVDLTNLIHQIIDSLFV